MSRGSIDGGPASLLIADGFHCLSPEAESTVNSSLFADDGVDWWAAILGVTESHDPGDARSADSHVIPLTAALLAKHIVEREDTGNGNGEALPALGAPVWIIRNHGSVRSVHHEVVRVIRLEVDGISAWIVTTHVEVAVDPHGEVVTATVNKRAVAGGEVSATTVTCPWSNRSHRRVRRWIAGDVRVVVMDALIVADYATVILVLLVINSGSSEVRSVDSGLLLIDRHEGRLHNRNWRCAVRIARVKALIDLVSVVIRVGVLWVCPRSNFCTQFQVTLLEVLGFALCLLQERLAISY